MDKLLSKILIIALAVLLVAALVLVAVAAFQSIGSGGSGDETGGDVQAGVVDPDSTGKKPIGNGQPLYKTNASRSSYISKSSSNVKYLSSDTNIKSNNAILVELSGYTSIAEKNADEKIYPASMTKVMTLLVASEMVTDPDKKLIITNEHMAAWTASGGSGGGWYAAGDGVRVEDLLHLVIYDSDTIACWLLAEYFGGSQEGFVALMNEKAEAMGLKNTHFANVTGLHDAENYTTCREMAAIMAYAFENPFAKKVLTAYNEYVFSTYEGDSNTVRKSNSAWSDWYSGRLGDNPRVKDSSGKVVVTVTSGKTGWETIPTACFVTYATDADEKGYVAVVVGRSNDQQTKVSAAQSTTDTKYIYSKYV